MAANPGATLNTYASIDPTKKTLKPIVKDSDVDRRRPNSRGFHQCRPAFFQTGAVNSASGSAYAEFGNTKIWARESKKAMMYSDTGRLNCNVSYTTFSSPARGQSLDITVELLRDRTTKSIPPCFTKLWRVPSCWKHSRRRQLMFLPWFWNQEAVISQSLYDSCASLALADAGIMMYDLVASVFVSCLGKNLLIDPVLEEESHQDGSLLMACMPSHYEVTQLSISGEWSTPHMNEAMQLCLDACAKLGNIMRSCLKESTFFPKE